VGPGMSSSRSSVRSPERQLPELSCRGPDATPSSAGRAEPSAAPDRDHHSGCWEFVAPFGRKHRCHQTLPVIELHQQSLCLNKVVFRSIEHSATRVEFHPQRKKVELLNDAASIPCEIVPCGNDFFGLLGFTRGEQKPSILTYFGNVRL
jgi:hypothetical protein